MPNVRLLVGHRYLELPRALWCPLPALEIHLSVVQHLQIDVVRERPRAEDARIRCAHLLIHFRFPANLTVIP